MNELGMNYVALYRLVGAEGAGGAMATRMAHTDLRSPKRFTNLPKITK